MGAAARNTKAGKIGRNRGKVSEARAGGEEMSVARLFSTRAVHLRKSCCHSFDVGAASAPTSGPRSKGASADHGRGLTAAWSGSAVSVYVASMTLCFARPCGTPSVPAANRGERGALRASASAVAPWFRISRGIHFASRSASQARCRCKTFDYMHCCFCCLPNYCVVQVLCLARVAC